MTGLEGQALATVTAEVRSGGRVSAAAVDDVPPYPWVRMLPMPLAPLRERGDDREGVGTSLVPGTSPVLIRHASQQSGVHHGAQPFAQHVSATPS